MPHRVRSTRVAGLAMAATAVVLVGGTLTSCSSAGSASAESSVDRVLLVGKFHGHAGQYRTIQAAVDAAHSGDWILVAPGDYHEADDLHGALAHADRGGFGGVVITTSDIRLRGMNRSTVVVDGTKAGSPACSGNPADQQLGPKGKDGKAIGRNGIVVYKAGNVSVENLTVCNFLAGSGHSGNEIWWNGGADSGNVGLSGYSGSYLTATSTYYGGEKTAAQYGVFSSNASGTAVWNQIYANNFNDSGMYVGACLQVCGITIDHAWMEYNALGYSGTNSGGSLVVENSQFDNNQDGFDTNTQIGGDPPAPQNGACANGALGPITHTKSCWVFVHNDVHDNNNPNVPKAGSASAGPTGTGMTISGGKNDTVMDNTFSNNGAWGVLFVPYPDSDKPVLGQTCATTGGIEQAGLGCIYDPQGDALLDNTFVNNGSFGNPGNADYGQIVFNAGRTVNCYAGNIAPSGSAPPDLAQLQPTCNGTKMTTANTGGALLAQVLCDTGFAACPSGANYPQATGVVMHPLPADLPTMANPCTGIPSNPWCPKGRPT